MPAHMTVVLAAFRAVGRTQAVVSTVYTTWAPIDVSTLGKTVVCYFLGDAPRTLDA